MKIKYTTFVQWRMEGHEYGPRHVHQTRDIEEATSRFTSHVKLYHDNIEQGDCHVEMVANIDGEVPKK